MTEVKCTDRNKAHECLVEARRILRKAGAWTKRVNARNWYGLGVEPTDSNAVSWCLGGAMALASERIEAPLIPFSVVNNFLPDKFKRMKSVDLPVFYGDSAITLFNDDPETTHDMVLDVLDRAIEATKPA